MRLSDNVSLGDGFYEQELAGGEGFQWARSQFSVYIDDLSESAELLFRGEFKGSVGLALIKDGHGKLIGRKVLKYGDNTLLVSVTPDNLPKLSICINPVVQHPGDPRDLGLCIREISVVRHSETVRPIIYMHIPKTAGTSLYHFAKENLPSERYLRSVDMFHISGYSDSEILKCRFLSGHFDFNFVSRFLDRACIFTVLRDPVSRVLSSYAYFRSYMRGSPEYDSNVSYYARVLTIEEIFDERPDIWLPYANVMSSQIIGREVHLLEREYSRIAILEMAKANLKAFDFVGFVDRIGESEKFLATTLGVHGSSKLKYLNVSPPEAKPLFRIPGDRSVILDRNWCDIALYEWASNWFSGNSEITKN